MLQDRQFGFVGFQMLGMLDFVGFQILENGLNIN